MSQDSERYLYFNVGLLKDSVALDALWQDAMQYHMIDQPNKLIALRLTEYYELKAQGLLNSASKTAHSTPPTTNNNGADNRENLTVVSASSPSISIASGIGNRGMEEEYMNETGEQQVPTTLPDIEKNAEEAADYWALL